jgi:hypothetical protein
LPNIAGRVFSKAFTERGVEGIVKWELVTVADGERVRIVFEAVASPWRQGVWLKCDRGIEIDGANYPSVTLWSDNSPAEIICTCHTSDGKLHLYNIWDEGQGSRSQSHTSGMRVEALENGWRYGCNDIGFDAAFDKLVFRLERCGP